VSGGFINPGTVPEIAGPTNDADPVQSADGLTLYWSSDRPGGIAGDLDVWQAQRATTSDAFGNFMPVVSVNTAGLDAPSDVSEDGCRLYLTSTRDGRTGIYVATRPR
jgi:Tol biopolymer transport system component